MLTAKRPQSETARCVSLVLLRQTSSIGGSIETEDIALAVVPKSRSSQRVVMTVTPLAKRPITSRNTAWSTTGSGEGALEVVMWPSNQTPPGLTTGVAG